MSRYDEEFATEIVDQHRENYAECPECSGRFVRTGFLQASRFEPACERWECDDCGYEEDCVD